MSLIAQSPDHADVPYAKLGERELHLDLYLPTARAEDRQAEVVGDGAPLIVWVHGGAWRAGSKASVPVKHLLQHGFAIASVDYRLSGEAKFPAQAFDIKAAIRYLRANADQLGIAPNRFVIAGASAGGHLAALIGTSNHSKPLEGSVGEHLDTSSSVQAIVSFYGAANLETILAQSTPHGLRVRVPALELLLGGQPKQQTALAKLASPVNHVGPEDPALWLIHGDADPQMPFAQSVELMKAYRVQKLPVRLEVVSGGQHGGSEFYATRRLDRLAEQLHEQLPKPLSR